MCGIVAGIAQRDVQPILLEGLRRLEYRGYDSAGVAVVNQSERLSRVRRVGKVENLSIALSETPISGGLGIAHTRWATHGVPAENNAHPHVCDDLIAVVHNGIVENHAELRITQGEAGFSFTSETDTEVIVHQVTKYYRESGDLLDAVYQTTKDLDGAYALAVIAKDKPEQLVAVRQGSPLVVGLGLGENFAASDVQALLPVTNRFIYLENGDFAILSRAGVEVLDASLSPVVREIKIPSISDNSVGKGEYKHFMLKEIYEQPYSVAATLNERLKGGSVDLSSVGNNFEEILSTTKHVQIIACGTSYHAGLVAKYWIESYANIGCSVEVASEFRYRDHYVLPDTLFVTISQSGETADSLAALRQAQSEGYLATLTVCNVAESSLHRESDFFLSTEAGPEIGVASTKAFTTQLVALQLLTIALAETRDTKPPVIEELINNLRSLPQKIEAALALDDAIAEVCVEFIDKDHALFLGRGSQYPIAMEGALKLKEISYIHAEAYPAGELKHGPLALVDEHMPVIAIAPNDSLYEKLRSNLEEVKARGGQLFVFTSRPDQFEKSDSTVIIDIPDVEESLSPIVNVVYLQLLSYHTAVLKGTDVDQPRNLAKSVTVE